LPPSSHGPSDAAALTPEEAPLDFHDRSVHTGESRRWRLSVPIPAKAFTLEVTLSAKTLGHTGPYENSCGGFVVERHFDLSR
jgi:hypothetical protein